MDFNKNFIVNYQIQNKEVLKSFHEKEGEKYYFFMPRKGKNIKTDKFESALESFLYKKKSFKRDRFKEDLQGTILIDFITDSRGRVIVYHILNSFNNSLDAMIKEFCELKFSEKSDFQFKFIGIRLEDKKGYCKFVLPISFEHKRGHRTFSRPDYSFMHQMMFQQQMMWQQQQMMRPSGF